MNVHIYYESGESQNLGLVRIHGSCPAEKLVELVNNRLRSFHINFDQDIVGTTSDGASVMIKFGSLTPSELQLCYNHAIHLAVLKVFYCKSTQVSQELEDDDRDIDGQHDDFSEDEDDEFDYTVVNELSSDMLSIHPTVSKIREIVKKFKNSPVRNSVLQRYVLELVPTNSELQLLLDSKTRWNSLIPMIERFIKLIGLIEQALRDLNMEYLWDSSYTCVAKNIVEALKPVLIAVEALSRHDTNLLSSEGILKFPFTTLQNNNTLLSSRLLDEIQISIKKRRNASLVSLLKFLNNPNLSNTTDDDEGSFNNFFKMVTKKDLVKTAKSLMQRLYLYNEDITNIKINSDNLPGANINSKSLNEK